MKKAYKGYTIDVIVTKNGKQRYTAKVWIGPTLKIPRTLRRCRAVRKPSRGRQEAKQSRLSDCQEQINAYIENRRPTYDSIFTVQELYARPLAALTRAVSEIGFCSLKGSLYLATPSSEVFFPGYSHEQLRRSASESLLPSATQ